MNNYSFREMTMSNYQRVLALWQRTPGLGFSDADSREGIRIFLVSESRTLLCLR